MHTSILSASSVKDIEEAFSFAEQTLFSSLYYPERFDASALTELVQQFKPDTRKAVQKRVAVAEKRLERYLAEVERTKTLYQAPLVACTKDAGTRDGDTRDKVAGGKDDGAHGVRDEDAGIIVGLDEVGRGPLAGPVVVGAVVLDPRFYILGLNDSKKLSSKKREELAERIQEHALAVVLEQNTNAQIDQKGMSRALRDTFYGALQRVIEQFGEERIKAVCIDGVPLHIHPNEQAYIKGDAKVASIAAASIVAKVARDAYMEKVALKYPGYGFESNKGYGSAQHIHAIKERGLTSVHRRSFCTNFVD